MKFRLTPRQCQLLKDREYFAQASSDGPLPIPDYEGYIDWPIKDLLELIEDAQIQVYLLTLAAGERDADSRNDANVYLRLIKKLKERTKQDPSSGPGK